ncbi:MAG: hypothetical protein C5B53_11225 [Candidatus Melainabacteria bacterium]|nr:MAG: hypothetical protein C5B53_11225 [Candidatus Melainabacteria bacterium]
MAEKLFTTTQSSQKLNSLAQLLLGARMIDSAKLAEATQTAKRLDVPLDKAIMMLKSTSETNLKLALQANQMVTSGEIELELALRAVQIARQNGIPFEDALQVTGTVVHRTQSMSAVANALVELLVATKLITITQTTQVLQQAGDSEMSIGRTLLVNRYITRWTLQEVLTALALVKEEKIARHQSEQAILTAMQRRVGVLQVLFESGEYNECSGETLKISELIAMAGLISESDLFDCLEISLCLDKSFGQVMLDNNLITPSLLEAACSILDMVGSHLKPFQAAEALKQVKATGVSVYQAIAELQPPPQVPQRQLSLGDLVVESGLQTKEAVQAALADGEETPIKTGKRLMAASLIPETCLYKALRCYSLFKEGILSADQAVAILQSCRTDAVTIEDALTKAGWIVPARMHWSWV